MIFIRPFIDGAGEGDECSGSDEAKISKFCDGSCELVSWYECQLRQLVSGKIPLQINQLLMSDPLI